MSSYYNKKKGMKSKKVLAHAKHVNDICYEFIKFAREIAKEHSDVEYELIQACNRTSDVCNVMKSKIEGDDKHDASGTVIDIAKQLINNVARILIVADSADLLLIDRSINDVRCCLRSVEQCDDIFTFDEIFQKLCNAMDILMKQITNRQMDLIDTHKKEEFALVRAMWMRCKERLYTSSRVGIVHPELESGICNRNLVLQEINDAIKKIQLVIKGRSSSDSQSKVGILASCFEEFEINVIFASKMNREQQNLLQNNLEIIIKEATIIAESASTREERQINIHRLCKDCDRLLNILVHSNPDVRNDKQIEKLCKATGELKHYLQLATLDHIDDFYFLPHIPFQVLYNITADGAKNKDQHRESEQDMAQHVMSLEIIAKMACSLSVESYHNKVVRIAINNIINLFRQVVFATRSLANQSKSEFIVKNIDVYRKAWTKELNLLVEAVDEISPVNEFLYISLCHAKENVEQIIMILDTGLKYKNDSNGNGQNWADLDQNVDALVNRTFRALSVVKEERHKVVDERFSANDPVMKILHGLIKYTLSDTKKLCSDIVSSGKEKSDDLKKNVKDVISQLSYLQIEFSKASTRCDAYIESFKQECHSSEHELNKHVASVLNQDKLLQSSLRICSILKLVVSDIENENCLEHWPSIIQNLKNLNSEVIHLDHIIREHITNCRSTAHKSESLTRYSTKIIECSRYAMNESLKDMSSYVSYGDIFVAILSSSKLIVSYLPEINRNCSASNSKRKKVFKK